MVNFKFAALFIFASSLSAFALPSAERTVAEIKSSLTVLKGGLTILDRDVKDFPSTGGTLREALGIHLQSQVIQADLSKCAAAVRGVGVVSDADGRDVLGLIETIAPIIFDALHEIVVKKSAFTSLGLAGVGKLVKDDIGKLDEGAIALGTGLISACPNDLKSRAMKIKGEIDVSFAMAKAAYSNV